MKLVFSLLLTLVAVPAWAVFTPPVPVDGNGNVVPSVWDPVGQTWLPDSGASSAVLTVSGALPITDTPYTDYGFDTSAGGPVTDTIDLGAVYSVVIVTCNDSCVVMLDGTKTGAAALAHGDFVDRMYVLPYATRYLYVVSEAPYVYPKAIRVRGLR